MAHRQGRIPRRSLTDAGASEALGATLLIATVTLVVAASAVDLPTERPAAPAAAVADASARVGSDLLVLTHMGGSVLDQGMTRLVVSQGAQMLHDGPVGLADAPWSPGQALVVQLRGPLSADAPIHATLTTGEGAPLALAPVRLQSGDVIATSQARVAIDFGGHGGPVEATDSLHIEVVADHPGGRKMVTDVSASIDGISSAPIPLVDDGTRGDAVARDGRYVGYLPIPLAIAPGDYTVTVVVHDLLGEITEQTAVVQIMGVPPDPSQEAQYEPLPEPLPPPPPIVPFEILPDGTIKPLCSARTTIRVLGTEITYGAGGPRIPVRMKSTINDGATLTPLFRGAPVTAGDQIVVDVTIANRMGVRGEANYESFQGSYDSWVADPHVVVLKNGDRAPNVPAFGGQQALATFLAPYVSNGHMVLAQDEIIVLFEFVSDLTSSAADFQDLVVLYDVECV